ncbi:MAG: nucleotidyltransferase [Thaumarchaeota archaeon]|nr:nucleotidyltransferase [Nitrososphaerota archaeon]
MAHLNLEREAVKVTEELGEVVFIGALAVNHYARFRGTRDIDLAVAGPPSESRLTALGYRKKEGSTASWYTPRGIKVDFYTRDVGKIPVNWILKTSVPVMFAKKEIRVICLEGLILAKHRAGRSQDIADLRQLIVRCGRSIRWDVMRQISTDLEITELRKVAEAFRP